MTDEIVQELLAVISRSGTRISVCMYCNQLCLAQKRSLCCGDAVEDANAKVADFLRLIDGRIGDGEG